MLNFSAANNHHSPLLAGLVSNSILLRGIGPGQVPLIDLFLGAVSIDLFTRSITPPNQPSSEAVAKGEASDRMSQAISVNLGKAGGQAKHWLVRAGPMTVTVIALWFKGWNGVQGFQHGQRLRKVFLAATALNIVGAALRLWCFKTLGKFFTFQLAVADDQKVVKNGPYAWIRHPSYTGAIMTIAGSLTTGYMTNPLIPTKYSPAAGAVAVGLFTWMTKLVCDRVADEEEMLKKELGGEYQKYMEEVPRRFIPFIW